MSVSLPFLLVDEEKRNQQTPNMPTKKYPPIVVCVVKVMAANPKLKANLGGQISRGSLLIISKRRPYLLKSN